MKLNWGSGIIIVIVFFMSFILFFVYKIQSDSKYDNELVVENYYQQEIHFQDELNKADNANKMQQQIKLYQSNTHIEIVFPKNLSLEQITGKISFYRPSNRKLDFETPVSLSSHKLLIPKENLVEGRWDIIIDWKYEKVSCLNKFHINVN